VISDSGLVWYKVNKLFYKTSCANERRFEPFKVGYLTVDGHIIEETQEMYNASLKSWQKEFAPVIPESYDVARTLLLENDLLQSSLDGDTRFRYVDEILASFGPVETNHDLARKLSFVLVFLSPILDTPSRFQQDVRDGVVRASDLVNFDRPTLLPEVYSVPGVDAAPYEIKIKRMRAAVESAFYRLVQQRAGSRYNPEAGRKRTQPQGLRLKANIRPGEELAPGLVQKLRAFIGRNRPSLCAACQGDVGSSSFNSVVGATHLTFCNDTCFDRYDFK
jgi:hypothetical protein